jgi:hypothetical protein
VSRPEGSRNDEPFRKELVQQIRMLLRDQRLTLPGRINLIGDLILTPLLIGLAGKPLILELLSGLTIRSEWINYVGESNLAHFVESLLWVLVFIAVWVGCILAFMDYRKLR